MKFLISFQSLILLIALGFSHPGVASDSWLKNLWYGDCGVTTEKDEKAVEQIAPCFGNDPLVRKSHTDALDQVEDQFFFDAATEDVKEGLQCWVNHVDLILKNPHPSALESRAIQLIASHLSRLVQDDAELKKWGTAHASCLGSAKSTGENGSASCTLIAKKYFQALNEKRLIVGTLWQSNTKEMGNYIQSLIDSKAQPTATGFRAVLAQLQKNKREEIEKIRKHEVRDQGKLIGYKLDFAAKQSIVGSGEEIDTLLNTPALKATACRMRRSYIDIPASLNMGAMIGSGAASLVAGGVEGAASLAAFSDFGNAALAARVMGISKNSANVLNGLKMASFAVDTTTFLNQWSNECGKLPPAMSTAKTCATDENTWQQVELKSLDQGACYLDTGLVILGGGAAAALKLGKLPPRSPHDALAVSMEASNPDRLALSASGPSFSARRVPIQEIDPAVAKDLRDFLRDDPSKAIPGEHVSGELFPHRNLGVEKERPGAKLSAHTPGRPAISGASFSVEATPEDFRELERRQQKLAEAQEELGFLEMMDPERTQPETKAEATHVEVLSHRVEDQKTVCNVGVGPQPNQSSDRENILDGRLIRPNSSAQMSAASPSRTKNPLTLNPRMQILSRLKKAITDLTPETRAHATQVIFGSLSARRSAVRDRVNAFFTDVMDPHGRYGATDWGHRFAGKLKSRKPTPQFSAGGFRNYVTDADLDDQANNVKIARAALDHAAPSSIGAHAAAVNVHEETDAHILMQQVQWVQEGGDPDDFVPRAP